MLIMKVRIAILFLAGVCILTSRWEAISQAWRINSAYIFLTRSIVKQDERAASRFNDWAWKNKYSMRESDASAYGLAMLLAHQASNFSEDWLQEWNKGGWCLTTDSMRNEMIEWKVTESFAPDDLLAMMDCLDDQTSAQWLMSAAENRPEDGRVYTGEFERRGFVSGLSQADRIRLAAVYGGLADQIRRSGSSTEEVMALANKSLALNPQSEMALIDKALMLRDSGQFLDGIELLEQVTALYPKSTFAWECLAALRIDNSDYKGAESAARTSISSIPSDSGSWGTNLLAIALLRQGRCAEALVYAQVGVRNNPELPYDLLILGDVYWCLGDREQASGVYQQLEVIDPDYAPYVHERIQSTK
jgi:tetratricopeptide (TPR) repeat protein